MHTVKLKPLLKWSVSWLLVLCCILFSFPQMLLGADEGSVNITEVSVPTSTLSKDDSFSISFTFYPSTQTKLKSVSIVGEAIDSSDATLTLYSDDTTLSTNTEVSAGTIITGTYSNLTYTGNGSAATLSISTESSGSTSYDMDLKTVSTENMQGALILDNSSNSNLSLRMNTGESKQVSLQLKNVATDALKNSVAKVYFDSTTTGLSVTSGQYTTISSISSGGTNTLTFTLSATSSVKAGTYKLIVELNNMKQEISVAIDSNIAPPTLELSISENASFSLGEMNPLTLYIKNSGGKAAKNIKVIIEDSTDFAIVGSSNVKNISSIDADKETSYTSKLQLNASTNSNLVRLKATLTYSDESGETYNDTQTLYLNTNTAAQTNDLSITQVTSPSGTYTSDQNFAVSFIVTSQYGAENVKVSVKGDEGIIAKSQNVFVLSDLSAKQGKQYTVNFAATDHATSGNHPIEIVLEYEYQDKDFTMSQYASVNISNEDDEEDKTSPKVILSECITSPQVVQAGQDVTLDLSFLNTHPTKTIYNLTATVDFSNTSGGTDNSSSSLFNIVSSTNTLFTTSLTPGASNKQNVVIGTLASATAGTYNIYVKLTYQDEEGQEISSTETIPVTISQDITIDIAQIDLSSLSIGRSSAMTATIYNTSKSAISNVMMYLEADALGTGFTVTDNKSYLSSFSMGATEYYAPTLTGVAGGTYEVNLVIEYEDYLGDAQTLRYPFTVEVADSNAKRGNSMEGMDNMASKNGNAMPNMNTVPSSTNPWLIAGIAVLVAAVLFILFKVIKKRKHSKDFDIHE